MRSHDEIANENLMDVVGSRLYFMLWGFILLKGMNNNIVHILNDEN